MKRGNKGHLMHETPRLWWLFLALNGDPDQNRLIIDVLLLIRVDKVVHEGAGVRYKLDVAGPVAVDEDHFGFDESIQISELAFAWLGV